MIPENTVLLNKLFGEKGKHFYFCLTVFAFLALPQASFSAYFSGPPEVLSTLQFNSQGAVISDYSVPADTESLWTQADIPASEVDPYSDAAVQEEDPFGDPPAKPSNEDPFAEDPFADEEQKIANISDPFERWFNRPVYVFNDHLYEYFMRPVAQTYKDILADNIRIMIRNLYNTITFPGRLVSSLFQLKFDKAGRVIGRVLVNCTLGFLCMVDVANEGFDIKPVDEDFGQVLGFYGIPPGPYLMLPLLGPSSVRDGLGRGVDALMNPLFWLVPDFITGVGITSEQMVNEVSFYIDDIKALKEGALDPYISLRDFYSQRREILVNE